eukprot:7390713-Prymnesium_polylepis.2
MAKKAHRELGDRLGDAEPVGDALQDHVAVVHVGEQLRDLGALAQLLHHLHHERGVAVDNVDVVVVEALQQRAERRRARLHRRVGSGAAADGSALAVDDEHAADAFLVHGLSGGIDGLEHAELALVLLDCRGERLPVERVADSAEACQLRLQFGVVDLLPALVAVAAVEGG